MGPNAGENISYRLIQETARYNATVVSADADNFVLQADMGIPDKVSKGQYLVISGIGIEYYAEVVDITDGAISLRAMWRERREYFRVDDVFPVASKKMKEGLPSKRSKIFSAYGADMPDMDLPDETINPALWRMLVDINIKLGRLLERFDLEKEGILNTENRQVNISASGIRFIVDEKVEAGDTVEVKMFLPTSPPTAVITYGKTVRADDLGNGQYDVALHFIGMNDEVRDELIQYTLKRQREIIREQRQQRRDEV